MFAGPDCCGDVCPLDAASGVVVASPGLVGRRSWGIPPAYSALVVWRQLHGVGRQHLHLQRQESGGLGQAASRYVNFLKAIEMHYVTQSIRFRLYQQLLWTGWELKSLTAISPGRGLRLLLLYQTGLCCILFLTVLIVQEWNKISFEDAVYCGVFPVVSWRETTTGKTEA